ncbi:MAG: CDP-alcohol phosphatidyltransferase family protein [Pseudomonadales bacterium]|nr:CDP-alcohol phosphatidyltransferase family protein [Pseudomonadales bacterium]
MTLAILPNAITVVRILLVLPTAWLLWQTRYVEALVLMAIAGASDAVDGWLARRLGAVSHLGAALDPVADKLLVAVLFVVFAVQGHLPLWLVLVVLGRDLFIMSGAAAYRLLFGRIEFAPTLISKANTAVQISVLLMMLFHLCGFGVLSEWMGALLDPWSFYLLAVLAVTSGADYGLTWSLRAVRESRARRAEDRHAR